MLETLVGADSVTFPSVLNGGKEHGNPRPGMLVHGIGGRYLAMQIVGGTELWPRMVELMERHVSNRTLQEVDIGAYFADLVAGAIRHKIRMPPTYTMVFKALMTVEGIGKNIAPDMDFLSGLSRLLKLAPDAGISLVESIRQGTFTVVVEPRGLDKLVAAHRAGARLQAAAIGFVGCVLGLGMLYGRPGPAVSGYHVLPVLFAVAALFFAIPLLRVVLARWT